MSFTTKMHNILLQRLRQFFFGFFQIWKSEITKSHHVITMYRVTNIQVIFKDQQVRKRYREIINLYFIIKMRLSICYKLQKIWLAFSSFPSLLQARPFAGKKRLYLSSTKYSVLNSNISFFVGKEKPREESRGLHDWLLMRKIEIKIKLKPGHKTNKKHCYQNFKFIKPVN